MVGINLLFTGVALTVAANCCRGMTRGQDVTPARACPALMESSRESALALLVLVAGLVGDVRRQLACVSMPSVMALGNTIPKLSTLMKMRAQRAYFLRGVFWLPSPMSSCPFFNPSSLVFVGAGRPHLKRTEHGIKSADSRTPRLFSHKCARYRMTRRARVGDSTPMRNTALVGRCGN